MILDVLPPRLQLATLNRTHLPSITHDVLRHVFYTTESTFFSITLTPTEISMVMDCEHIASMVSTSPHMECCATVWRCLEVSSGETGGVLADFVNTVHTIAAPLARERISIFQLSTFDADYTLVPEHQLHAALQCLRPYFDIPCLQHEHPDDGMPSDEDGTVSDALHFHPFTLPIGQTDVYVAQFHVNQLDAVMRPLICALLYADAPLLSLTLVDPSLSMVADGTLLSQFPSPWMNVLHSDHGMGWRVIAVGDEAVGLGFEETGIVAAYTRPLKALRVNCFYLSTFHVDLILIPHAQADSVLTELKTRVDQSQERRRAEIREETNE